MVRIVLEPGGSHMSRLALTLALSCGIAAFSDLSAFGDGTTGGGPGVRFMPPTDRVPPNLGNPGDPGSGGSSGPGGTGQTPALPSSPGGGLTGATGRAPATRGVTGVGARGRSSSRGVGTRGPGTEEFERWEIWWD